MDQNALIFLFFLMLVRNLTSAFTILKTQTTSTELYDGSFTSEDAAINNSALSMTLVELSQKIGGKGRAQAAWDCLSIGLDPLLFHNPLYPEEDLDHALFSLNDNLSESVTKMTRLDLKKLLPLRRQTENLGTKALKYLKRTYPSPLGIEQSIASLIHVTVSEDGTTKLLLKLHSTPTEQMIETVIIPNPQWNKSTLCVSCQVGCAQACVFCATGKMGKLSNLTPDQILIQLYYSIKLCRLYPHLPSIDNIGKWNIDILCDTWTFSKITTDILLVFMGMGDAADNIDSVRQTINVMTDKSCFGLAPSKITISTVGPNPNAFHELAKSNTVLAWSVHAVRDNLRKKLVPTTKYTMSELSDGLVNAIKARSKRLRNIMLEVTLIDGLNDSLIEAEELAVFANDIKERVDGIKLVVNLIPFNDIGYEKLNRARSENVLAFQKLLVEKDIQTYIRTTRGDEEHSACGQLATKKRNMK